MGDPEMTAGNRTSGGAGVIKTVYRSEDHALPDRFDAWQEVTHSVLPMELSDLDPAAFTAGVSQADLGAASLTQLTFSPHRVVRDPAMIRRSDPEMYVLALCLRGRIAMSQGRNEALVSAGDLMLWDSSHPFTSEVGDGTPALTETLNLNIPKRLLPLPAHKVDRLLATPLQGGRGLPAVVADTLRSIRTQAPYCTPADAARLGTVAVDLLTALLARHFDGEAPVPPAARQSALLTAIEDFIQRRLGDPALTPALVAEAHHISLRYLHRLFEQRDTTVAALIRGLRLDRCRRDLAEPGLAHLPIRVIAARWGFPQPGEFSRAFTRAYGTPPSVYRRTVQPGGTGVTGGAVVHPVPTAVR
jgi:AraC-like DNA-binding protein